MSWRFPKWVLKNTQAMGLDDVNENFYEMTEEMYGQLNEHNWGADTFARANLANDVSMQLYHSETYASPGAQTLPGNAITVPENLDWSTVESQTFSGVRAGPMYICCSFQAGIQTVTAPASHTAFNVDTAGWDFALRINGAIIPETCTGTMDRDNDGLPVGNASLSGAGSTQDHVIKWTPGMSLNRYPFLIDAIISVPDGDVVVELVARMYAGPYNHRFAVFSREWIAFEMVR